MPDLVVASPAPPEGSSVGTRVAYASQVLLPARRFEEYLDVMGKLFAPDVHYVDPVHELHDREAVLAMLAKYVPRAANDQFRFELLVDEPTRVFWKWTIVIQLRIGRYVFTINGLVHADVRDGLIVYQREYYDPMESIGVIPFVGRGYKKLLQMG